MPDPITKVDPYQSLVELIAEETVTKLKIISQMSHLRDKPGTLTRGQIILIYTRIIIQAIGYLKRLSDIQNALNSQGEITSSMLESMSKFNLGQLQLISVMAKRMESLLETN